MQCQSPIQIVVEGDKRSDPPRSNPYDVVPRSSNNPSIQGWKTGYFDRHELRDLVEEDGDESMSSSPASFDTTSPMTTSGFRLMGSPSPRLGRVDSVGLSAIGKMNLRDGSVSPLPPFEEEARDTGVVGGVFGMDLNLPVSAEQDAVMLDISPNCWWQSHLVCVILCADFAAR
ncbi:hypothetical protein K440DRAFT_618173 [Wilcoxina mikolae CBS 423.85]|nr:hypothetical protein K440DRAFT_618173 [Wilcoxina mikolae CBS 423.85]